MSPTSGSRAGSSLGCGSVISTRTTIIRAVLRDIHDLQACYPKDAQWGRKLRPSTHSIQKLKHPPVMLPGAAAPRGN